MTTDRSSSKLAVILHADVMGSTALVQRDETIAHERIRDAFQRFAETIRAYGGTPHEVRGDALLATFTRASDAVSASLSFQTGNTHHNETLEDDIRPEVRIGIALGEVVIADGTLTGPDVVMAQRIEQLAGPGGICIQGTAYETIPRRLLFEYTSLGEQQLKGFDNPVPVYGVEAKLGEEIPRPDPRRPEKRSASTRTLIATIAILLVILGGIISWLQPWKSAIQPADPARNAVSIQDRPSVAVLPFENLSSDKDQEYFSDGITEDLITDLSRISGLIVIAKNSAFAYKERGVNVQEVGRELNVGFVLEGSVRRSGSRVRINAQLIDARTGHQLWSDRYDRELVDVFALQDEITREIVSSLAVTFDRGDEKGSILTATTVPDAYDTLLRGLERLRRFTPSTNIEARKFFERAAELDPNYARAYANIAITYARDVSLGWSKSKETDLEQGAEYARRALEMDNALPHAHFAVGLLKLFAKRHDEAIAAAEQAVRLEPSYADGYALLAIAQNYAGYPEQGIESIHQAMRLNPLHPFFYLMILGRGHFQLGRYEDAIAQFEQVVERNPEFADVRLYLSSAYGHVGREDDAIWEGQELQALIPDFSLSDVEGWQPYARPADLQRVVDGLRKAGFSE